MSIEEHLHRYILISFDLFGLSLRFLNRNIFESDLINASVDDNEGGREEGTKDAKYIHVSSSRISSSTKAAVHILLLYSNPILLKQACHLRHVRR